ncbi:MAG: hypothetical protein J6A48_07970, partial [Clostridia bacterium]|nr:hypothetical protein [Clostridia bacterium]
MLRTHVAQTDHANFQIFHLEIPPWERMSIDFGVRLQRIPQAHTKVNGAVSTGKPAQGCFER